MTQHPHSPLRSEAMPAFASSPAVRWEHLQMVLYFNVRDIRKLLIDAASRQEVMQYFTPLRANKVYLEYAVPVRGGDISDDQIAAIMQDFQQAGMITAGALVPSRVGGSFCYETQEHLDLLRTQSERLARRCDEIIIDDWLFTTCSCPACVAARGTHSWGAYRGALLVDRARTYILEAARAINPRVKVIIKFPNWWEGFHHNGYALEAQVRQFPAFCQGIETRSRVCNEQHLPSYTGYFLQRWSEKLNADKRVSCWFDNHEMNGQPDDYLAQVYQGVLGGSREMVVWSGGTHYRTGGAPEMFPVLTQALPALDRLAGLLPRQATGTPTYIPYDADGEYNLPGYLGMIGIPIDPVPYFPEDGQTCILTLHSAKDPALVERILARLAAGREVVMTWRLFQRLRGAGLDGTLQVIDDEGYVTPHTWCIHDRTQAHWSRWKTSRLPVDQPITFKKIRVTTWPDHKTINAITDDGDYGVLLSARYLNGMLHVLNVPEKSDDLLRLPQEALKVIRRVCTPDVGMILDAPANVAWYPFGPELFVLYNMNPMPAAVTVTFPEQTDQQRWHEIFHGLPLTQTEDEYTASTTFTIPAFAPVVLEKQR